ncbi:MAG: hypothetical protein AB8H47_12870 [Bacteroidia bacterium]
MMRIFTFCLVFCSLLACQAPHLDPANNPALELPLLSEGPQVGIIQGFNGDNPPAIQDSIAARMSEAQALGIRLARIQVDWSDLEPSPNQYALNELKDQLEANHAAGLETMLTLSSLDSDAITIPEDLLGQAFNEGGLLNRFKSLMDEIVPLMSTNGGWLISIANEPDTHFEDEPKLWKEVRDMVREIRIHTHQIDPNMAVTLTLTEGGFEAGLKGIRQIVEECDVACFNYYGQTVLGQTDSPEKVRSDLTAILDAFPDKALVIQELGCSAGYTTGSRMEGASEEAQRFFFETVFEFMERNQNLRAAIVFQVVDWSPATAEIFRADLLNAGLEEDFVLMFLESLETLGLISFETGKSKPAWNEFLKWVEHFAD